MSINNTLVQRYQIPRYNYLKNSLLFLYIIYINERFKFLPINLGCRICDFQNNKYIHTKSLYNYKVKIL